MKKIIIFSIIIISILSGCVPNDPPSIEASINIPPQEEEIIIEVKKDEVEEMIENMSLDEKLGQMIIIGFDDININENIENMIERNHVGGVILFKRNISDSNQLSKLISDLKEANIANKIPIFISVDEEGGRVSRLPQTKKFLSSRAIGKKNDKELAFQNGKNIGSALLSFGFNMDFAPVLDISSNPKNTVIGDRAFGNNPDIVSVMGIETMKGLQSQNIISVIKHFPGHGDTKLDSHFDLPVIYHEKNRLHDFELIPFKKAIDTGADVIMAAHIEYPKIDESKKPATLSKKILTDLLRDELNFDGVIITDDMEMGAIDENFGIEQAAVEAIAAGADILLVCQSQEKQELALASLKEAVENGSINIDRIDESVERILKLKRKYLKF